VPGVGSHLCYYEIRYYHTTKPYIQYVDGGIEVTITVNLNATHYITYINVSGCGEFVKVK